VRGSRAMPGLALAVSAMLLCAGLVAGVTPPEAENAGTEARARLGGCVPTGPRRSVEELNSFIDNAAGVSDFLGADVGVDVRLGGGRSLWLFADTLRSSSASDLFVRNSMLLFSPGCAQVVLPPGGGAVVPDRADGVGYWPMSAWRIGRGDTETVSVMLQRVGVVPGQGFGFITLGPALATFRVPPSGPPELLLRKDLGADDPSTENVEWGAASTRAVGWLYLYGTSTRPLPGIHGFALRVARVRPRLVADLDRWRYWDGHRWQPDPGAAVALLPEQGGVSQTLSVWHQDGRWYVLSKQDEFLGRQIVVWPGPSPVGPFGPAYAVADLPCDTETGELRYMPLAHPGLLPQPGTVVVSYSRNYADIGEVCAAPKNYRPHFLRVALP
jgi:hypothetical protein